MTGALIQFFNLTARDGRHIGTWQDDRGLVGRAGLKSRYPGSKITKYYADHPMSEASRRVSREKGTKP